MGKKLTWEEITRQYQGEWVELVDCDWDETEPDPKAGIVRVHSKDRKQLSKLMSGLESVDSAVVFVGDLIADDSKLVFNANKHQYVGSK